MSGRGRWPWITRPLSRPIVWSLAALSVALPLRLAIAQPVAPAAKVDRLSLENGLRVVLVRTERAGPVAITVAARDASLSARDDDLGTLALSELGPWGDLPAGERGALLTARSVRSRGSLTGHATLRTLQAPGDELPVLLFLAAKSLREAAWDEAALTRAVAQKPPAEGPLVFSVARERLFPRLAPNVSAEERAKTPLERLRGLERVRLQRETVISIVGDFDVDHVAELVHQHLDAAPRRPLPAPSSATSTGTGTTMPATGAIPLSSRAFAVTLAVRLEGDPGRRHALRIAFDVLTRGRLRSLRDSTSILMVNELDEPTAGARLVAIRFVATDAAALRVVSASLAAELAKFLAAPLGQAELAAATARLSTEDDFGALSASRRAVDSALGELAGERLLAPSAGAAPSPAAVQAVLAEGFGEERRTILTEQPAP